MSCSNRSMWLGVVGSVGLLLGACSSDPDPVFEPEDTAPTPTASTPGSLSPAEMMANAAPGVHHQHLAPMIGDFKAVTRARMDPNAPEEVSEGRVNNHWILGKRFLAGQFTGEMGGQPFQGFCLLGYDNTTRRYQGTWMDSMGTAISPISTGRCSANGTVITLNRVSPNMTGEQVPTREVITILDQDHHTYEMFSAGRYGGETRTLHIEYTRLR